MVPEITQPFSAPPPPAEQAATGTDLSFDLPTITPSPAASPAPHAQPAPMDFDLDGLSLDLDVPATPASAGQSAAPGRPSGFGDLELPDIPVAQTAEAVPMDDGGADPLARKLELAEEFRQIGDMEGARDLLQEVLAKADGTLKSKAQSMLDDIA